MGSECIFCRIVAGQESSWKVYEDDSTYAFLDISPIRGRADWLTGL